MKKVNIRRFGKRAYIQMENNRWVKKEGLIGVFDLDKSTISPISRKFVRTAEKNGMVTTVSEGLPRSFLYYDDGIKEQMYLSVFSVTAIKNRLEQ